MVGTDHGDQMRAKFVIMANDCLTEPKLAIIDGMDSFRGKAFHTSRWVGSLRVAVALSGT